MCTCELVTNSIKEFRRMREQVGDQGEDFQLFEWMHDVTRACPDRWQGLNRDWWVVELIPPLEDWEFHPDMHSVVRRRRIGYPEFGPVRLQVFLDLHLARQKISYLVSRHGGTWSTLDDGIAVHVITANDYEVRLSYWGARVDGAFERLNIHRKPKGGNGLPLPRPPATLQTWYERIPPATTLALMALEIFGPLMPCFFVLVIVLAGC